MPYNSLIDRTDAGALIPEDVSREIIQSVPENSAVLSLARRLPNMTRAQRRMPVLSMFPSGYFVNGDTGVKQTTNVDWANKYIDAEEIAVIVPIPESVLDDVDYDIWGEVKPLLLGEFGRIIDLAVLFGTNAPASWPTDVLAAAVAAGNSYNSGSDANKDLYDEILGDAGVLALIEADGFAVSGHVAAMSMKGKLRGLREKVYNGSTMVAAGAPLFVRSMQEGGAYTLDGETIVFPKNGGFDAAQAWMISGDWNQLVYSIRQDMTYKLLTEAVIQDAGGNIIYNLAQQDMVALRCVMRLGWQVPNPINRMQETEASRYPFGALLP